jgi:hypothetical protein
MRDTCLCSLGRSQRLSSKVLLASASEAMSCTPFHAKAAGQARARPGRKLLERSQRSVSSLGGCPVSARTLSISLCRLAAPESTLIGRATDGNDTGSSKYEWRFMIVANDYTVFPCRCSSPRRPQHFATNAEGISSNHAVSGTRASSPVTRRLINGIDLARCPSWLRLVLLEARYDFLRGCDGRESTPLMRYASKLA